MTPAFATKFDATAKVAGELATKTKATVRAEVREVGVRDGDANRVTLVIFVNQTTTSTITQGKPRVDLNRTRFAMDRNGDQWLVQEIAAQPRCYSADPGNARPWAAARTPQPNIITNFPGPRRISFAKISEPLEVPDLLALQVDSFDWLVGNETWQARVAAAEAEGRT